MFKKYILNYKNLTNIEKLKTAKIIFYSILLILFTLVLLDRYYFKFLKNTVFSYSMFFIFGTSFYLNYEKKLKKKINLDIINKIETKK
jgi:hypothetical protein